MQVSWLRRALLAAACVSAIVVAACGGGTVVSQFNPNRVVAFGDAFSDVGQRGTRYTVNNATAAAWNERIALRYGLTLRPSAAGGFGFGIGSARVRVVPDAGGDASTPTITQQVDTFLATQPAFSAKDLVLVNAGIGDIVAEVAAINAGTQNDDQALAAVEQAAADLAAQVKRIANSGAEHVGVVGVFDLGRTPWATQTGQATRLSNLSQQFNIRLKTDLFGFNIASRVLYIDAEFYYNLVTQNLNNSTYGGINNVTDLACNSIDPGPGIGTGAGQVNSALCTDATITPGINIALTLFADRIYVTPAAASLFGDYAFDRLRARW
ncbi:MULTISPECIES: SGNH/GDSL hydrolase family protein [Ramlibacter]|uniref:GDSL family lipase n=1 Tax=Ramlibacter pinisoli TaxID=2682844 RepID=A0A6N8J0V0_9BURK|nr:MULTISPECIES: SGNH/GDSL hydrolase family protein [Ramlibacter]MBA2962978.1 GDSL family lipase [Ramlibacter sp. CGMCC 1.13660]MVQ32921.1 GDSL family lipase [Ramlibacter pinisoli]